MASLLDRWGTATAICTAAGAAISLSPNLQESVLSAGAEAFSVIRYLDRAFQQGQKYFAAGGQALLGAIVTALARFALRAGVFVTETVVNHVVSTCYTRVLIGSNEVCVCLL